MEMIKEVKVAVDCLSEHKAEDIVVLDVSGKTPFASFFILATCLNERSLDSLAGILPDSLSENGFRISSIDGKAESGWIVVNAGEVVVQLFTEKQRKTINLDELLNESKKVEKPKEKNTIKTKRRITKKR